MRKNPMKLKLGQEFAETEIDSEEEQKADS